MSATRENETSDGLPAVETRRVELPITGMTCAACARRVERGLSKTPGVDAANVNFATSRATVEYDPRRTDVRRLVEAVEGVGYGTPGALTGGDERATVEREEAARRAERRDLARRFTVAAVLSRPVLAVSMSHGRVALFNVWWINWLQLALTAPVVFYSGAPFYSGAWAALRHRAADMNTLTATGTGAAFVYAFTATVAPRLVAAGETTSAGGMTMSGAGVNGVTTNAASMNGAPMVPVYFEAASVIIALILLGRLLEARARGRTTRAIKKLFGLQGLPPRARQ